MKNNLIILLLSLIAFSQTFAEDLNISASSISFDKKTKISILKDNVVVKDHKENTFKTNYAEYKKDLKYLESRGITTVLTSEGYLLTGENIIFDNKKNFIKSNKPATLKDLEDNNIYLENFEYSTSNNFFRSTGNIKVIDNKKNLYNFSQIYIDEKKREILGTDIKAFLNDRNFKINEENKPRVFANTVKINKEESEYSKSVFTLCNYRKNDKCPPWTLQAKGMRHDAKKKTVYYDKATLKIYDLPIFYFPKLSHPDPTVDRRSGFLLPSFMDAKNLGASVEIPYYWTMGKDKDFTLSSKLFSSEHPLFLGEYRQALADSNLILDFGYTEGYKNTTDTKIAGNKSHFFSKFVKNFKGKDNSKNNFELTLEDVSHDKYFKLYKIKSNLINYEKDTLENSLNFNHESEDEYFAFKAAMYETLKESYNDKYQYILPEIIYDKNLFSNKKFGAVDFQSNLKMENYDTNKTTKFLINNIDWKLNNVNNFYGLKGNLLGKLKNVNYDAKNTSEYRSNTSNELYGAIGYLSEIDFIKTTNNSEHFLTPKMLLRFSPDHMRKETVTTRLNHLNLFNLDRLNVNNNLESGLSTTLGFDYEIKQDEKQFNLTLGQIIKPKENKSMPSSSSLDQKTSDLVGNSRLEINDKISFNYNFALDHNFEDLNYNEVEASLDFNPIKFNFNYLEESKHIGNQEYFKTEVSLKSGKNALFAAETKRNLITNSAEYYNLSYEYMNDCLRAGLVYRREFYEDSELEAENSLMFKLTFIPFGNINSPSFN